MALLTTQYIKGPQPWVKLTVSTEGLVIADVEESGSAHKSKLQFFDLRDEADDLVREKREAETRERPKRYHEWKGRVVSERTVRVFEGENYMVIIRELTIRVKKPTLQQLVENSREHFDFLVKTFGERGRRVVNQTIENWRKWLETVGDEYEMNITVAHIRPKADHGSINFVVNLYKWWFGWRVSDPVNLVFYGPAGSAWDVQYDMKNWLTHKWSDTSGWDLYTWIDKDHADEKDWTWKKQDYQLRYGDYFGVSYHIRIYDGGYDWDQYLEWSIAGAHREEWDWTQFTHVVIGWEDAERFIRDDFENKWFVGSIQYWFLGNSGYYQNFWNDGYATVIELKH
jgi:hypothetical protein